MAGNFTNDTAPTWQNNTASPWHNESIYTSDTVDAVLIVLNILISVFSITGNGFVIFVYFRSTFQKDTTTKVMFNLALTDLTTGCIIAFYFVSYVTGFTDTSFISCMFTEQILTAMMLVSETVLTISTFDRYISICHNSRYQNIMTRRNLAVMLLLAWLTPIMLALLPVFGFNHWNDLQACHYSVLFYDWIYQTYSTIMIAMMLLCVILFVRILVTAHRFYRRLHPVHTQGVNSRTAKVRRKIQSIRNGRIMGVITFIFILCWLPFQINQYNFGSNFFNSFSVISGRFTFTLGLLNSVVNPFLYGFQKQDLRAEVKKLFKCFKRCRANNDSDTHEDVSPMNKNEGKGQNKRIFIMNEVSNKRGKVHPWAYKTNQPKNDIQNEVQEFVPMPSTSFANAKSTMTESKESCSKNTTPTTKLTEASNDSSKISNDVEHLTIVSIDTV